jgi:DNA-binding NarL/FixJ family response regulator
VVAGVERRRRRPNGRVGTPGGRGADGRPDAGRGWRGGHAPRGGGAAAVPREVMLTTFDLDDYVFAAWRAGASGFLLKTIPPAEPSAAVRARHSGELLFAPTVTRRLVEAFVRRPPPPIGVPERLRDLTERELEVFRAIARGLSNAEIATELYLGEATVKTHVTRVLWKLELRDRVQAVVLAYECGLALLPRVSRRACCTTEAL